MTEVESLEAHYYDLKSKLTTGALSAEEFRNQVARLWFEDELGHTWMIGAQTGHWYVYKNDRWTQGEPPREHTPGATLECPRCGEHIDLHATFCGHCGYQLTAGELAAAPESDTQPKVAAVAAAPASAAPRPIPSRGVVLAAGGAVAFAAVFLCLAVFGGILLLRGGNLGIFTSGAVAAVTPTSTRAFSAARVTSTPTAGAASPTPIIATIPPNSPSSVPQTTKVVPTPIIVYIETETPAPTASVVAIAPTATDTPAPSPTSVATPTATDTAGPPTAVPATSTPAPPTNTPVPRPPTNTPVPAIVMSGRIAFTTVNPSVHDRVSYDTYIASPDGSNRVAIAPRRRQPAFSPDGSRVVVMGMEDNRQKLLIKNVNTGQETDIANTPVESMQPSWSPDGATVLFAAADTDDRQSRLYVVDARGAPDVRVPMRAPPRIDLIGRYPTWLPNGQIVYTGCDKWGNSGQCGIIRVNPDGASPTLLTANERDGIDTAPGGNGGTVLFMSHRDGNWEVYSVPIDGGEARNLSNSPGDDGLPVFSPDGNFIAFISNRSGAWAVWAMRPDGGDPRQLFTLDGAYATGAGVDWTTERLTWGK